MNMLYLPNYLEENDESFLNPSSDWYLGNEIISKLPKLSDHIEKLSYQEKKVILDYLRKGTVLSVGFSCQLVYDGNTVYGVTYSDGTYIWSDTHIHYVEKYSLDLPQVFKKHIFSFSGELTDEQKRNIANYSLEPSNNTMTIKNFKKKWSEFDRLNY